MQIVFYQKTEGTNPEPPSVLEKKVGRNTAKQSVICGQSIRMTAQELLAKYAAGERYFRGARLGGADLSGANLSGVIMDYSAISKKS